MGDIAQRGNRLTAAKGGRASLRFGGGRTDLLEQLGRVEGERSNPNRRAEISRVHSELNKGYKDGGRIGFKHGTKVGHKKQSTNTKKDSMSSLDHKKYELHKRGADVSFKSGGRAGFRHGGREAKSFIEHVGGSEKGKPHSTKEGRIASGKRKITRFLRSRQADNQPKYKNPKRKFPPEKPTWSDMPRSPLEKPKYQPLKKGGKSDKNWIQKATASIKKRGTKGKCTPITKPGCTGRAKALAKTFKKMAAKRKA